MNGRQVSGTAELARNGEERAHGYRPTPDRPGYIGPIFGLDPTSRKECRNSSYHVVCSLTFRAPSAAASHFPLSLRGISRNLMDHRATVRSPIIRPLRQLRRVNQHARATSSRSFSTQSARSCHCGTLRTPPAQARPFPEQKGTRPRSYCCVFLAVLLARPRAVADPLPDALPLSDGDGVRLAAFPASDPAPESAP